MSQAVVVKGPPRVSLTELAARIRAYLAGTGVERAAVLFGSFARGEADEASDLDLLLVEPTSHPLLEHGCAHLPLFRLGIGVDLLVYTPQEYARLEQERHPLIERIACEGVLVYARPPG